MNGTDYLGDDIYVEDEETVTRIFVNEAGKRLQKIEMTPEVAQRLFEVMARTRSEVKSGG